MVKSGPAREVREDREALAGCCAADSGTEDDLSEVHPQVSSEESEDVEQGGSGSDAGDEPPPVRVMLLVFLCMFQGYASMVGPTQQKFKAALHISQHGAAAATFTQAANFVHWGKFVARLGHNVVFHCLSPLTRVYISMCFMLVGCAVPPFFVFGCGSTWVGWVFISYGMSGIGLGVFECTFLNVITPLGRLTKMWAIMGAPLGFGMVCVLGLVCTSVGMPVELLYWYIVACVPVGMLVLWRNAPDTSAKAGGQVHKQASLVASFAAWNTWLPRIIPHIMGKIVVNFVMENVTPVNFYTYNASKVPLLGPSTEDPLLGHDVFFAILYVLVIIGDSISRRIPHGLTLDTYLKNVQYLMFASVLSLLGFYFESYAIALITWPAVFLAFFGNGLVYGVSAKYIDLFVPKEHNLAAYSLWCFAGDAGSIAGGSLVDVVRDWICGGHVYPYECLSHNR